jgi:hypothetical protein
MGETLMEPTGEELSAEVMELHGGAIETLQADQVNMQMGGAQKIEATEVFLHQSAAAMIEAGHVDMRQTAAIAVRGNAVTTAQTASLTAVADRLEQRNCRSGVVIARVADMHASSALVLLAGQTNGPVETLLDTRGALLAGLIGGTVMGAILIAGSLIFRRR